MIPCTQGQSIYLITDMHLYHDNIKKLQNRPEGFEDKIARSLASLPPKALLIDLGDVVMASHEAKLKNILNRCKATKVLVMGNHDTKSYQWYYSAGYNFVCEQFAWPGILFSHRPIPSSKWPEGCTYNIFGHLHGNKQHMGVFNNCDMEEGHIHFALEDFGYRAIHIGEIIKAFSINTTNGKTAKKSTLLDRKLFTLDLSCIPIIEERFFGTMSKYESFYDVKVLYKKLDRLYTREAVVQFIDDTFLPEQFTRKTTDI